MLRVMLCGASDTKVIEAKFRELIEGMKMVPLNYISGKITYHNYGANRWEENSRDTVDSADILILVAYEKFGSITWKVEYERAIENGKNLIILINRDKYQEYQTLKRTFDIIPESINEETRRFIELIEKIEKNQLTIIPFDLMDFSEVLKEQLSMLFHKSIKYLEENNKKQIFIPILKSIDYISEFSNYKGDKYKRIAKSILFDQFEDKNLRKRALDYFIVNKGLSEDEIIELCVDAEQGVARKTLGFLAELISSNLDIDSILSSVTEIDISDDVGLTRRLIASVFSLDHFKAIRHLSNIFPCQDIGTPRRVIHGILEKRGEIVQRAKDDPEFRNELQTLISLCLSYQTKQGDWKENGEEILNEIKES